MTSLPCAALVDLGYNVVLQPPLSRRGKGPGLIIIRPECYAECKDANDSLDPEPLKKWAEESFCVVQITLGTPSHDSVDNDEKLFRRGMDALKSRPECTGKDKLGFMVYGSPAEYSHDTGNQLYSLLTSIPELTAGVYWGQWLNLQSEKPTLLHTFGSLDISCMPEDVTSYSYPEAISAGFVVPGHPDFRLPSGGVAHTRTLSFLKKHLGGPFFDLEKIWDEHTLYEFGERSVEKTMATMVDEPCVNHVPTLTGGIGRARLTKFYLHHFIFNNPDDAGLELISRTVGIDRVVDEFNFCLTHNKQVDWLIPGIPPTGKYLRIPFTAIVNIRGDRLYHEHIAWDQATVLVQLGLMPEYLPFPYPLADGSTPAPGKRFEYRVPAAGVETAQKLENEHLIPSNRMFEYQVREVDNH